MIFINNDYYKGFEGEPEIQFICKKGNDSEVFVIWEGYFDQIMKSIRPGYKGWEGIAYYYNMYLGWYEESPWAIQDLETTLNQFESIDNAMISNEANTILKKYVICLKMLY